MKHSKLLAHQINALRWCSILLACSLPSSAIALDSIRFQDTIMQGVGLIDLFGGQGSTTISPQTLEALRVENNGRLVLGVDVNEASDGTEKASSQGVTIESLTLRVTIGGTVNEITSFFTATKSVVAKVGELERQTYYTLLGRTGSNNITGSGLNGTSFDATLTIPVEIDISQASSIELDIKFLETNTSLGDPEAFYDYSAGFEDLAILTEADASFLDEQAAGREEAPLVVLTDTLPEVSSHLYYPASDEYYIVGYEDNYPNKGDYDFNDLVVGYRIIYGLDESGQVKTLTGEGYLIARGGSFSHDWHLRIPLTVSAQLVGTLGLYLPEDPSPQLSYPIDIDVSNGLDITVYSDTTQLFTDPNSAFTNTPWDSEHVPGHKFSFSLTFENSVALSEMPAAPFDPYLFVRDTQYEIHLPGRSPVLAESVNELNGVTSFLDESGYPFALVITEDWKFPNEYVDLGDAYPEFLQYVLSGRSSESQWYLNSVSSGVSKHSKSQWKW